VVMEEKKKLGLLLVMEDAAVLGFTFGFFKNDLTDRSARVDGKRHGAGVGHF